MKSLATADHLVDRTLQITTVGADGLFHLTSMGTDSIIDARVESALLRYKANADLIANCGIDPDVARSIQAGILAQ
mgnify:CR=1 FL=1